MQKKILILTASYWAWHNVAANTMKNYYTEKWYQVHTIDLVEFLSSLWKWTQSFYQDFCSKYPNAWDITYNILDKDFIKKILFWVEYPFSQKTLQPDDVPLHQQGQETCVSQPDIASDCPQQPADWQP